MTYDLDDPLLREISAEIDKLTDLKSHEDVKAFAELSDELLISHGIKPDDYINWLADRVHRSRKRRE